jgi:hypothetical protein
MRYLVFVFLGGMLLCSPFSSLFAKSNDFSDLTIVVNSCDKYEELWEPFFKILFSQWQGLEKSSIPIVLIANTKKFNNPRVRVFNSGKEISWSDTVNRALNTVKTRYILYLQDDYFITHLDLNRLEELFNAMKKEQFGYMQISCGATGERKAFKNIQGLFYKNKFEKYRTSLQAAFWDKKVFSYLLNLKEKIWDFEIKGSMRSEGNMAPFMVIMENEPIIFMNMVAEGHLDDERIRSIQKMYGIQWDHSLPLKSEIPIIKVVFKQILIYLYWSVLKPVEKYFRGSSYVEI